LRDATDAVIWKRASIDGAVVVPKDEDFIRLAATDVGGPRVLWVRTGNVLNRVLMARFEAAWTDLSAHLLSSARVIEFR
jgi:predicted nuclease of predicted toxin-antitoxin system